MKIDMSRQATRPQVTVGELSGLLGGGQAAREVQDGSKVVILPCNRLHTFTGHTYRVIDDTEMALLVQSIREHGLMEPLQVRPHNGDYEIISGHRRHFAAERVGLAGLPCIIVQMDDDTAIVRMVEANRYREKKLPSEKAFSYRAAADAVNRQGKRTDLYSDQDAACTPTLAEITGESERNVRNWIRLTELIPPLLELVDVGLLLPVRAGVELSFLIADKQWMVLDYLQENNQAMTVAQAIAIKEQRLTLTTERLQQLLSTALKQAPPPSLKLHKLELQQIRGYIPELYRETAPANYILRALEYYQNHAGE